MLNAEGLHQCTRDHLRGDPDPFESLYRDRPLSALISADAPVALSLRRLRVPKPCVLLVATDGAFGCLPTPMEFEMLLLNTLRASADWGGWERPVSYTHLNAWMTGTMTEAFPAGPKPLFWRRPMDV